VRVLVVNAGSSSLKLTLLACAREGDEQDTTLASQELEAPHAQVDPDQLRAALD
jgi:acetate kinase